MRIFDPLNSQSHQLRPGKEVAATTGKRLVDWAHFIASKSHGTPLVGLNESVVGLAVIRYGERAREGCYNSCPRRINVELGSCGPAVKEGTESGATQYRTTGRGFEGAERGRRPTRNYHKTRPCTGVGLETKDHVSGGAQANCNSPARALGKVESSTPEQVSGRLCADAIGSRQRSATCGTTLA